jgi:hypothetical protein
MDTEELEKIEEIEERQEIVLSAGERRTVYARPFLLGRLVIPKGAALVVPRAGQTWLIFDVEGDAVIDGQVIYREVPQLRGPIESVAPNGDTLVHEFSYANRGGSGGTGGEFQGRRGGRGSEGSTEYGGGGGSGGWHYRLPRPGNGRPGAGRFGGAGAYGDVGRGGDGGERDRYPNGGLVYINVSGVLTGTGTIDVRGMRGRDGLPGAAGSRPGINGSGGGGGGGGGPGGAGGAVVIRASNNTSNLGLRVDGGAGGPPGAGGRAARDGQRGEDGAPGKTQFL